MTVISKRKTYEIHVYPDGTQSVMEVRSGRKIATFVRFSDAKAFKALKERQGEESSVRNLNRRPNRTPVDAGSAYPQL